MEELVLIQNVIEEYFKSEIQSEAEVSSKFIVPLSKRPQWGQVLERG